MPLKRLLIERTEGNPFFLEESVRALVETGGLVGERGAYRPLKPLDSLQVPATVQAVLAARIDRLPPEEKRLLQTAAVIGTDVPFALLQAIGELSEEELRRALGHLQAAEFLYETSLFPELEYTFKHALTHEVAYRHSPAGAAPGPPRRHCRGQRTALCRPSARASGTAGPACLPGRGVGQGRGVLSAGGGEGHDAVGPPRGRGILRADLGSPHASP